MRMCFVSLFLSQLCWHALEASVSCRCSTPSVALTGFVLSKLLLPSRQAPASSLLSLLEFSFSTPCPRFKGVSPGSSDPFYWRMVLDSGPGMGRAQGIICNPTHTQTLHSTVQASDSGQHPGATQIPTSFGPSLWQAKSLCVLFVLVLWPSQQKPAAWPGLCWRHFSLQPDSACHSAGPRDSI